jgi:hypothetical protein
MEYARCRRPGPYERAILAIVGAVADRWWPEPSKAIAVGCPLWVVDRLSDETGIGLRALPGAECELAMGPLRIFGSQRLSNSAGGFVVQDLVSGWSYRIPLRCHRDVPPASWSNFTTALSDGLTIKAAADIVRSIDAT